VEWGSERHLRLKTRRGLTFFGQQMGNNGDKAILKYRGQERKKPWKKKQGGRGGERKNTVIFNSTRDVLSMSKYHPRKPKKAGTGGGRDRTASERNVLESKKKKTEKVGGKVTGDSRRCNQKLHQKTTIKKGKKRKGGYICTALARDAKNTDGRGNKNHRRLGGCIQGLKERRASN